MSAITDLLAAPSEDFTRKSLPAAAYLCQIVHAELLGGYWKPSDDGKRGARWFTSYVPTIKIIDVIPSGDPEQDATVQQALSDFGDWQGKELRFTQYREIPGYSEKKFVVGIEMAKGAKGNGLNYTIGDATESWASATLSQSATRFYTAVNSQGKQDGWVVTTLSKEPNRHVPIDLPSQDDPNPLGKVIEATIGSYLVVDFVLEADPEGKYEPKFMVSKTSSV
jgi:hypothetical protein